MSPHVRSGPAGMFQDIEIEFNGSVKSIPAPENLHVGHMIEEQRKRCASIGCTVDFYNFAFGQSPFPVPSPLQRSLGENAHHGHYSDTGGIPDLKDAVSAFYRRHFDLNVDLSRIIVGHGTTGLMYSLFSLIAGSVIIPSPAWIGYASQLKLLGRPYHLLPTRSEHGYKVRPQDLDAFLNQLPAAQHLLILNNPHNPTGAVYTSHELERIARVCREHGVFVLADEIYGLITFHPEQFTSMGSIYPEGTFVTSGLSKDRSCGGYRLGTCILPRNCSEQLKRNVNKIAATVYTNASTPTQYAAVAAYQPGGAMDDYFRTTRSIHRIMGTYLSRLFNSIDGIHAIRPEGGFYFLADFNDLATDLQTAGVKDSNGLSRSLLAHPHHIATISGTAIMMPPTDFSARIAFVDYNGHRAYQNYQLDPPRTSADEEEFVKENAPHMISGVIALLMYVEKMREKRG